MKYQEIKFRFFKVSDGVRGRVQPSALIFSGTSRRGGGLVGAFGSFSPQKMRMLADLVSAESTVPGCQVAVL